MADAPNVEVGGARLERGQVLMPIPREAAYRMTPQQIAETYVPILLATAKENGGTLTGTPEILTFEEIKPRMGDAGPELIRLVDEHPSDLFVLATMVPHDWSRFDRNNIETVEHVAKPRLWDPRRRN